MWPYQASNPRHMALESDALPTALRGPAFPFRERREERQTNKQTKKGFDDLPK